MRLEKQATGLQLQELTDCESLSVYPKAARRQMPRHLSAASLCGSGPGTQAVLRAVKLEPRMKHASAPSIPSPYFAGYWECVVHVPHDCPRTSGKETSTDTEALQLKPSSALEFNLAMYINITLARSGAVESAPSSFKAFSRASSRRLRAIICDRPSTLLSPANNGKRHGTKQATLRCSATKGNYCNA